MTRTPSKFSRASVNSPSNRLCTSRYIGSVRRISPATISDSNRITAANRAIARNEIVPAMIIAPITTKGERKKRRSTMLIPPCTWFRSLVRRVSRADAPILSIDASEKSCMWQ